MVKCSCSFNNELIIPDTRQKTTTEVNMARVYNWDVKRRQGLKQEIKQRERIIHNKFYFFLVNLIEIFAHHSITSLSL
jgi:hypothetical protein